MNKLTHQQAKQALDAQADGLLKGDELSALEEHLANCADCRAERSVFLALEKSLRQTFHDHSRLMKAGPIDGMMALTTGRNQRSAMRERRLVYAAALIALFLFFWLVGVGVWQAWPPDQLLRLDKTRPAILPSPVATLAAYEPSPTPTEEPLVWRWQPSFSEDHLVETPRPGNR